MCCDAWEWVRGSRKLVDQLDLKKLIIQWARTEGLFYYVLTCVVTVCQTEMPGMNSAKPCCLSKINRHQYKVSLMASTSDYLRLGLGSKRVKVDSGGTK